MANLFGTRLDRAEVTANQLAAMDPDGLHFFDLSTGKKTSFPGDIRAVGVYDGKFIAAEHGLKDNLALLTIMNGSGTHTGEIEDTSAGTFRQSGNDLVLESKNSFEVYDPSGKAKLSFRGSEGGATNIDGDTFTYVDAKRRTSARSRSAKRSGQRFRHRHSIRVRPSAKR